MQKKNGIKAGYGALILQVFGEKIKEDLLPISREDLETIDNSLATLTDREQRVLRLRFGLETGNPLTLKKVGHELGVTTERSRQLEKKTINRLRYAGRLGKCIFFYSQIRENIESLKTENKELRERIAVCEYFMRQQEKNWIFSDLTKEQAIRAFPILAARIDEFEFSLRLLKVLRNMGAKTIYDVVIKNERNISLQRGVGRKCLEEIKEFLSEHGLELGMRF